MSIAGLAEPLLIELDEKTRAEQLDRAESWFNNVLMTQVAFRKFAEDTRRKVQEPHLKDYLNQIATTAQRHESQAEELYRSIGRDPSQARKLGGTIMAKAAEGLADVVGIAGGAAGPWRDLRQLFLASANSLGAFAVAEQLGFALGIAEIPQMTFGIVKEKWTHHRLLEELVLEFAAQSILYQTDI